MTCRSGWAAVMIAHLPGLDDNGDDDGDDDVGVFFFIFSNSAITAFDVIAFASSANFASLIISSRVFFDLINFK